MPLTPVRAKGIESGETASGQHPGSCDDLLAGPLAVTISPVKSLYTGQSVGTVTANPQIAVFFFRSTMISPGG
jgi:hypothetical protein